MALKIDSRFNEIDRNWEFDLVGELDIYTSGQFKDEVLKSYNANKENIVIKGDKLLYVDSTGLGALIYILKELKENKNVIYCDNIKSNIKKLFTITDLDKLFIIRGESNE